MTMIINIKATNIDLTPPLKVYIEEKVGSLSKFLTKFKDDEVKVSVDAGRSSMHHHKGEVYHVDINIVLPHETVRAEEDDSDLRVAINSAKDKLKKELVKYKEKKEEVGE